MFHSNYSNLEQFYFKNWKSPLMSWKPRGGGVASSELEAFYESEVSFDVVAVSSDEL